jgi:hypothetical protein
LQNFVNKNGQELSDQKVLSGSQVVITWLETGAKLVEASDLMDSDIGWQAILLRS